MEKLLKALGVRDHVDLQLVFSRLLGAGSWDQEQVVRVGTNGRLTLAEPPDIFCRPNI
jgi:hypothetical protein